MNWTRHSTIGRGSTATVSLATSALSGEVFAAKSAEVSLSKPLQKEQSILSKLNSPHIVNYKGFDFTQESNGQIYYNLFMEYFPRGTLFDEIRRLGGKLGEPMIRAYTWQILRGLEYLHANDIIHCDIKTTNLLIGKENVIKISDFGCSKSLLGDDDDDLAVFCGTPMYMSPEVVLGQRQGFESDIWSLGCTVFEMASGKKPWPEEAFHDKPFSALCRIGFSGESPEIPSSLSEECRDFLVKCFERNPSERLSAKELLKHPFFDEDLLLSSGFDQELSHRRVLSPSSVFDHFDHQSVWNNSFDHDDYNIIISSVAERFERLIGSSESLSDWTSLESDGEEDWITIRSNNNELISTTTTTGDVSFFHSEFLSLGFHVNNINNNDIINISTISDRKKDFVIAFDECEENDIIVFRKLKLLKEGNEDFSSLQYFPDSQLNNLEKL